MFTGYELEGEAFKLIPETDPRLKEHSVEVFPFEFDTPELYYVIDMMTKTMMNNVGVGLAAPQVGIKKQIIVTADPLFPVLINPRIVEREGEQLTEEGCLSFPKLFAFIKRARSVTVEYQLPNGTEMKQLVHGYLAVVVQHEVDHLYGIVFTDYMSKLKLNRAIKKRKSALK